jgi:GNAT superfamily N-acetyltransferase
MTLAVRLAVPGDADAVASLLAAFRDFYGERNPPDELIRSTVADLLADPGTEFLLAGDPPIGIAATRFRLSVWTGAEDAWLEDLYVEEEARRDGIGRALVEACFERALERGCRRIQLDCNEGNRAAVALYEAVGFSAVPPGRWGGGRNLMFTRWL